MEHNMTYGQIWKGSNAQITVPVLPPCSTAETTDMVANFYTTPSGTSIEFTQTGGTLQISGTMATVVFQPIQLQSLDDGLIKYNVAYTIGGSATTVDLETRWYLKTPIPFEPIDYVTTENVGEIVDEELNERLPEHMGEYAKTTAVTEAIQTATTDMATKTWVAGQGYLTQHQSLQGYATEQWVNNKGYLTQHQDISMKADSSAVTEAIQTATTDMATKTWTNNQGFLKQHQSLDGYATQQWVNNKGYLTQHQPLKTINNQSLVGSGNIEISGGTGVEYSAGTNIDITNHVISVCGITVPTKTSELTNDSGFLTQHQSLDGYATEQWVEGKGYLTQHQDISMKADSSAVTEAIGTATQDMATKTWVGGQGYLTQHQSLADYSTTTQMNTAISTAVSGKVGSATIINIWSGTLAEYNAIQHHDISTLYLVK